MTETIIIAGAGHAAGQTATTLRQKGYKGRLIIIGEEAYIPYQRPPLSKAFLAGELEIERLYFRPEKFYVDHDVETRLNTRIDSIATDSKQVTLSTGETLDYDHLILTTGSRVRELPLPGADLAGIYYLRNIDDVYKIQAEFEPGKKLAIIGGGYIGLEVAAIAVKRGLDVTVLETEARVMNRVVAPEVSEFFQTLHHDEGVKIELGRKVEAIRGDNGRITAIVGEDGYELETDFCVVGIGILPNEELAASAGIDCDNGVLVDEFCRTSVEGIYAAGDCTRHPNAIIGRQLRLESVHNAIEQGKTAAMSILGELNPYTQVPWFWSDQYDVKLQIVGMSTGYDQAVVRGNPDERAFAVFYLKQGKLLAVDAINSAREFMLAKKLVTAGASFDPVELADMSQEFKPLAMAALEKAAA